MGNGASNVRPLADRVVVKPLEEAEQMKGSIYIPDTAKEKPSQGEIVAVGPGKMSDEGARIAPDVTVGDKVLYGKYSGTDVTLDGDEYLILRESDILAIVPSRNAIDELGDTNHGSQRARVRRRGAFAPQGWPR